MPPKAGSVLDQFRPAAERFRSYDYKHDIESHYRSRGKPHNIRFIQRINLCLEGTIVKTVVRRFLAVKKNILKDRSIFFVPTRSFRFEE
jgi:hypothetical protein